jgi:hypothetical protein
MENEESESSAVTIEQEDLKPKPRPKLAPRGIEAFTVCRQHDETGVSGEGVIIEGVVLGTGQCYIRFYDRFYQSSYRTASGK